MRLNLTLKKYAAVFSQAVQSALEYRANFLIGLFTGVFIIIIQYFMWTAIYGKEQSGRLFGYDYKEMIVYVIMAGILSKATATGFEWEIASDIKDGGLSRFLVQPVSYLPYRLIGFLGSKLVQMFFISIISVVALVLIHIHLGFTMELSGVVFLLIAVALGILLNSMLFYCLSACAFWVTEVYGVFLSLLVVSSFLSGGVFPLEIFGTVAMKIMAFLPFQYIVYFPLNILNDKYSLSAMVQGFLIQMFWIGCFYLLSKILWKQGMKKYIAAGG